VERTKSQALGPFPTCEDRIIAAAATKTPAHRGGGGCHRRLLGFRRNPTTRGCLVKRHPVRTHQQQREKRESGWKPNVIGEGCLFLHRHWAGPPAGCPGGAVFALELASRTKLRKKAEPNEFRGKTRLALQPISGGRLPLKRWDRGRIPVHRLHPGRRRVGAQAT